MQSKAKSVAMVYNYCVIFLICPSVMIHSNENTAEIAIRSLLTLWFCFWYHLFLFWVIPRWRLWSWHMFILVKSFISTSCWDLCTSSTDRAPPHGEDEKEEEKKTVGSQARNLCVAPPLQGKPSRPATRHNGDLESVFDDSTLSELSEEDRRYTCSIYMLFNAASL